MSYKLVESEDILGYLLVHNRYTHNITSHRSRFAFPPSTL